MSTFMDSLEIGIHSLIASFLSHKDLESYIQSYPPPEEYFWSLMIREKFPEYYIPHLSGYIWKDVYMGLLDFYSIVNTNAWYVIIKGQLEFFRYMVTNKFVTLNDEIIFEMFILECPLETIKFILFNYDVKIKHLTELVKISSDRYRLDVIKFVFEYAKSRDMCIELVNYIDFETEDIFDHKDLTVEGFNLIWDIIKDKYPEGLLGTFAQINHNNETLINYILEEISKDATRDKLRRELNCLIFDGLGDIKHIQLLFDKFGYLLDEYDRKQLYDSSKLTYGNGSDNPFSFLLR